MGAGALPLSYPGVSAGERDRTSDLPLMTLSLMKDAEVARSS